MIDWTLFVFRKSTAARPCQPGQHLQRVSLLLHCVLWTAASGKRGQRGGGYQCLLWPAAKRLVCFRQLATTRAKENARECNRVKSTEEEQKMEWDEEKEEEETGRPRKLK